MGSIILPATGRQTATIIFLHGLGDSGASWAEILPSLVPRYVKLILPHAEIRPVTINQGIRLPAWFDLRPLDQPKDSVGIKHAAKEVQALIQEEEKRGTPGNRIVLGGFSQGGALALYSGLTGPVRLGGILALSTWLPIPQEIPWDKIQKLPILQCHGDQDPLISAATALKSSKLLETHLASSYTFKMYPGLEHNISSEEEMKDISTFFETVLPPSF